MAEANCPNSVAVEPTAGTLCWLPLESLNIRYASLRPGSPCSVPQDIAELPLRVVPTAEGRYELIDGFKRLKLWQQRGVKNIPVVVEQPCAPEQQKRLLLMANCPPRTLTALDEGRVVSSLQQEQKLSPSAISRLLCRKPQWVAKRLQIATGLSEVARRVPSR